MRYLLILNLLVSIVFASEVEKKKDILAQDSIEKWSDGYIKLKAYRTNYLLPFGYRDGNYKSYVPTDKYRNIEAELQVSLKLIVGKNLLGLDEYYYFAYSHQAFWQVYTKSSPFRETTYNPEGFVVFPIKDKESYFNMQSVKVAFAHRSNGQGSNEGLETILENRSRSINYIYSELEFKHDNLITELTCWVPLSDSSDNPDLMNYVGYTSLRFNYFLHKHMFSIMGRGNIVSGMGAVEATYSYPLVKNESAYLYIKLFSGYGESLIDYNNYITKFSIGFSFSR